MNRQIVALGVIVLAFFASYRNTHPAWLYGCGVIAVIAAGYLIWGGHRG